MHNVAHVDTHAARLVQRFGEDGALCRVVRMLSAKDAHNARYLQLLAERIHEVFGGKLRAHKPFIPYKTDVDEDSLPGHWFGYMAGRKVAIAPLTVKLIELAGESAVQAGQRLRAVDGELDG